MAAFGHELMRFLGLLQGKTRRDNRLYPGSYQGPDLRRQGVADGLLFALGSGAQGCGRQRQALGQDGREIHLGLDAVPDTEFSKET